MKKLISILLFFILCVAGFRSLCTNTSAFFSASSALEGNVFAERMNVKIEKFSLDFAENSLSQMQDNSFLDQIISGKSKSLSFDVNNCGNRAVELFLEVEILWDKGLEGIEKVFLYPQEISDEAILAKLHNKDYSDVIIGWEVEQGSIWGIKYPREEGLRVCVDYCTLSGSSQQVSGSTISKKSYGYKLILFDNHDLDNTANQTRQITINIIALAVPLGVEHGNWYSVDEVVIDLISV